VLQHPKYRHWVFCNILQKGGNGNIICISRISRITEVKAAAATAARVNSHQQADAAASATAAGVCEKSKVR